MSNAIENAEGVDIIPRQLLADIQHLIDRHNADSDTTPLVVSEYLTEKLNIHDTILIIHEEKAPR